MTRARTLADLISDGVIGTTELADDAITPVKLDAASSYTMDGLTLNGNLDLQDNDKILVGTGDDLQIYHDGSNSYINDIGTGNLLIRAADSLLIQDTGGKTYLKTVINAQTELSYNNSTKLSTTSSGIEVDGVAMSDSARLSTNSGTTYWDLRRDSGTGHLVISDDGLGDVITVTQTSGNVGIGTGSDAPSDRLVVKQDSSSIQPLLVLKNDNTTDDNGMSIDFSGKDTSSNNITYGRIDLRIPNHATEKSDMRFSIRNDSGSFSETLRLTKDEDIETIQDARIMWRHQPGGTARASIEANSSDQILFKSGSSLARTVTIDGGGTVLIGRTSSGNTGGGHTIRHNDSAIFTRNSSNAASETVQITRHASDGMVMRLNTGSSGNGTQRGGIGVTTSGAMYFTAGNSTAERVRVQPTGGISFNGDTAQANALDDYEEGTWSPTVFKGSEVTGLYRIGTYTRIGRTIHLAWYVYKSTVTTSGTNIWKIGGLPFSGNYLDLANGSYQFMPAGYLSVNSTAHNTTMSRWQVNATNQLTLYSGIATTNSSGGHIEFSGTGTLILS